MSKPLFNRIAVVGPGLIGSSIMRAARVHRLAGAVVATSRTAETRERVRALGIADDVADTAADAVKGADLIFICVPVSATGKVAAEIAPHLADGAIVTDVGSVKGSVIRDVEPHLPECAAFVGGHPIAGTEESGPDAGFAELFEGRWWVLTPAAKSTPQAVEKLTALLRAFGSSVETMDAEHHDRVLAITSHVPHLIAYNIVGTVADLENDTKSEVIKFSASGFRDFTRIAASDPVMWRDIFLNNSEAILEMLGRFTEDLTALQRHIRRGDGEALQRLFTRTRAIRRGVIEAGQDIDQPDFGRTPAALHHDPDGGEADN
jgi:cyclohexadieny/prephenate dehydrogenase